MCKRVLSEIQSKLEHTKTPQPEKRRRLSPLEERIELELSSTEELLPARAEETCKKEFIEDRNKSSLTQGSVNTNMCNTSGIQQPSTTTSPQLSCEGVVWPKLRTTTVPTESEEYYLDEDIHNELLRQESEEQNSDSPFGSLKTHQELNKLLSKDYLTKRGVLSEWIADLGSDNNTNCITVSLAISYLDRFMSKCPFVQISEYQLVAAACFLVAAKREEKEAPTLRQMSEYTQFSFSEPMIEKMEEILLNLLEWRLNAITPFHFLLFYKHKLEQLLSSPRTQEYVNSFVELSLFDKRDVCCKFSPSVIACGAIAASQKIELKEIWGEDFEKVTGKKYKEIEECSNYFFSKWQSHVNNTERVVKKNT